MRGKSNAGIHDQRHPRHTFTQFTESTRIARPLPRSNWSRPRHQDLTASVKKTPAKNPILCAIRSDLEAKSDEFHGSLHQTEWVRLQIHLISDNLKFYEFGLK